MNIELKGLSCDDEAAEIAEAAVVLPLMFMILVGIYWFGMVFNIYATSRVAIFTATRYP